MPRGTLETLCTDELLEIFRFVAIERLRKLLGIRNHLNFAWLRQPELGFGMRIGVDGSASSSSSESSEEWNTNEVGEVRWPFLSNKVERQSTLRSERVAAYPSVPRRNLATPWSVLL